MSDRKEEFASPPAIELLQADSGRMEEPHRRWWIWLVYLLLFGASIPWYLPTGGTPRVWFGLPHWVVISLGATVGIAVFTAIVVHRYWREAEPTTTSLEEDRPS